MSSPFNRAIFRNEERRRAVPDVAVDAILDLGQMERAVYTLESQNRRSNTAKAYESKKEEFIEFCKSVYAEQPPTKSQQWSILKFSSSCGTKHSVALGSTRKVPRLNGKASIRRNTFR
ncbi:hypothetical protein IV203_000080 [Nitzschia inconspicua]|uniref:Uncharacterized protein n=1 Tax=Nitzschia inconspicua TaxID=303405 RepID=A0A9K3PS56_9STRA|nr:hypothetical protein IV203_000080 [Nitzschia inconspicua]